MKIIKLTKFENTKYILIGIYNTFFGYFFSAFFYLEFKNTFSITSIALIINIVILFQAFVLYKIFIFKNKKNIKNEIIKFISLNFTTSILSGILLIFFININFQNIWIIQIIITLIIGLINYLMNLIYTFNGTSPN